MNNNDWLDIDVLEDYLDGKLDAKAMHRVERLSLEDPFVAEALAGLSQSPKRVQSLSLLQKQLQDRIVRKPVEQKRWQITSQRLSIAAAAAVLFVTVSLLFWMREKDSREQLAANAPKKVEVAIAPAKSNPQMEKAVVEAKENVYAGNTKRAVKKPISPPISAVMADPVNTPILEKRNEVSAYRSPAISDRKVVDDSQVTTALAGKVSGIRIQGNRNAVRGIVFGDDKLPLPGAYISLKEGAQGTVTDVKGQFILTLDSLLKNPKLSVTAIGFVAKEVEAKTDKNLSIELKADQNTLSEVVVIPTAQEARQRRVAAASTAKITSSVEPVGGWDKFQAYLTANNKLLKDSKPTGGFVAVYFKFAEEGIPFEVRVFKTFNIALNQAKEAEAEAIRLIKEGPKWLPTQKNANTSIATVVNIQF